MGNMAAVLWCNGEIPSDDLVKKVVIEDSRIFGVDGGAEKALSMGVQVEKVLGDLDSINLDNWKKKIEYLPNQNISDFGKSVKYLVDEGFTKVDVIGIDGGSPEHLLGIWGVLSEIEDDIEIILHHENRTSYRIHPNNGVTEKFIERDKKFSIFALTHCENVHLSGAQWNIEGEKLSLSSRGLHNLGIGEKVRIEADGIIVLIV